jgi:mRNA interferase HigB
MRVISNRSLREFAGRYPDAALPLQAWRKLMEHGSPRNYADLKRLSNSVDRVGSFYVFDISGNRDRVIAAVHFDRQMLFVRHVFTHAEYDRWRP